MCQLRYGQVHGLCPDDGTTQLACELRQKHGADRAAGWNGACGGAVKCYCCHIHTHTDGVKGLVRANLSSALGYRAALIAALAKFQRAQA